MTKRITDLEIWSAIFLLLLEFVNATLHGTPECAHPRVVPQDACQDKQGVADLGILPGLKTGDDCLGHSVVPLVNQMAVVFKLQLISLGVCVETLCIERKKMFPHI